MAFCRTLPATWEARRIASQLINSATSTAVNYRAAGRARSTADFIAKLGIVVEEADETVGWLELVQRLDLCAADDVKWLYGEAQELLAIFAASQLTAKDNYRREFERRRAERAGRARKRGRPPRSGEIVDRKS